MLITKQYDTNPNPYHSNKILIKLGLIINNIKDYI